MGKVVLHIHKAKGNDAGTSKHIEREVHPPNADPTRTHLNWELIELPEGVKGRTQAIQHRIENAGIKRKISHNQIRVIQVNLSGSHEDMLRIQKEGKLDEWCKDSLEWLQDTFGKENIVSAVLHLDEKTPHIHAALVPIVKGERRKAKAEENNGKKKYRKSKNAVRLCADDIMERKKLESYQDTYAEKMQKYGLERGVRGSEARHITTQQFYNELYQKNSDLEKNIQSLQQTEQEVKKELSQIKKEVNTGKLKSSTINAATQITDSIGSLFGNSKVKQLEEDKQQLNNLVKRLEKEIETQKTTITDNQKSYEKENNKLKSKLKRIFTLFPYIKELLRMETLCKAIGFTTEITLKLISLQPVKFSGNLYSEQYRRKYETENSIAKIEKDPNATNRLRLSIDNLHVMNWFRKKHTEEQSLRQSPDNKKKGIRM